VPDPTQAIQYFDKALAMDPNDIVALDDKGAALDRLGYHAEAIEYYNKALSINPNDKIALCDKEIALSKLGH
jgi:tetratricopeptide (TPR) repeat protein